MRALMDNLAFEPTTDREHEAALLADFPPAGSEVMAVRSLRLPLELDEASPDAAGPHQRL
jgi:hypothetical protein